MSTLLQSLRSLTRTPAFALTVIAIIAIGVGANTAIFSVLRTVLLRPLPLHEPERLVRVYESPAPTRDGVPTQFSVAPQTWLYWREHQTVFEDMARAQGVNLTMQLDGADAQRFSATRISHNFFSVLGVKPILGRDVRPEEDRPGAERVVLIAEGLWQRAFGGRTDVLGRVVTLDGLPYTIIGVLPKNYRHPYRSEIWVPFASEINPAVAAPRNLYVPARLKPGVSFDQAWDSMRELCLRLEQERPSVENPKSAAIRPLREFMVVNVRGKLLAISTASGFLLLIVGTNIASLLLARHVERSGEVTLRSALGASRGRLVRDALVQCAVLALVGSALGVSVALASINPLYALSPLGGDITGGAMRDFATSVNIDPTILAFSIGLTLLLALGAGLLPALRSSRVDLNAVLKGAGRSGTLDRSTKRLLGGLVVAEVAVAVVLLVATGLMVRSFKNLSTESWGFATDNRLSFEVSFTNRLRPEHADRVAYVEQALERLRALPGVVSANATTPHIMYSSRSLALVSPIGGAEPPQPRGSFLIHHRMVFPRFFEEENIRIVRGRAFTPDDRLGTQRVAIVSEALAQRFWPGQDPIGKELKRGRLDDPRPGYVVVGVASDIKIILATPDSDTFSNWYLPYAQNPGFTTDNVTFVVHGAPGVESLVRQVRTELAKIDPALAVYNFNLLSTLCDDAQAQDRFALLLVSLFGAIGLLLSAIGLYGLLSLQVARRTRELGVRTALGARAADIVTMIMREGFTLVLVGLAVGFAAALALTRVMQSELHGVTATDPLSYLLAATVLALAAAIACYLPARRAARTDPATVLRSE